MQNHMHSITPILQSCFFIAARFPLSAIAFDRNIPDTAKKKGTPILETYWRTIYRGIESGRLICNNGIRHANITLQISIPVYLDFMIPFPLSLLTFASECFNKISCAHNTRNHNNQNCGIGRSHGTPPLNEIIIGNNIHCTGYHRDKHVEPQFPLCHQQISRNRSERSREEITQCQNSEHRN